MSNSDHQEVSREERNVHYTALLPAWRLKAVCLLVGVPDEFVLQEAWESQDSTDEKLLLEYVLASLEVPQGIYTSKFCPSPSIPKLGILVSSTGVSEDSREQIRILLYGILLGAYCNDQSLSFLQRWAEFSTHSHALLRSITMSDLTAWSVSTNIKQIFFLLFLSWIKQKRYEVEHLKWGFKWQAYVDTYTCSFWYMRKEKKSEIFRYRVELGKQ